MASVDDIDELIATRRLNGVDDGLYESDKNVANMTEEAFNEIINNFEVVAHLTMYGRKGIKENVKKLQARIKELEEENKKLKAKIDVTNWQEKTVYESLKERYIPKQKVKEGLESIEDYFERLNGPDKDIEYIRQVKQELLEKEESRNE